MCSPYGSKEKEMICIDKLLKECKDRGYDADRLIKEGIGCKRDIVRLLSGLNTSMKYIDRLCKLWKLQPCDLIEFKKE